MKAVRYHEFGPPEVLQYEDVPEPVPGPDDVLIRVTAVGVNHSEVSRRAGTSPLLPGMSLPVIPGYECSGIVAAVGSNVTGFKPGDRVCANGLPHTYAEYALAPAARTYLVPQRLSMVEAATLLSGLTMAWQAVAVRARVQPGETVLVHSVASGTGIMAAQMAKHLGARVIGTATSEDKLAWAKGYGMDHGVNYTGAKFADEVLRLTDGKGVEVVIDGMGDQVLLESMKCMQRYGRLVNYGRAWGKRSVEIVLPDLFNRELTIMGASSGSVRREDVQRLLGLCAEGTLKATVDRTWPLAEAAAAHRYIEERRVQGRIALLVSEG